MLKNNIHFFQNHYCVLEFRSRQLSNFRITEINSHNKTIPDYNRTKKTAFYYDVFDYDGTGFPNVSELLILAK